MARMSVKAKRWLAAGLSAGAVLMLVGGYWAYGVWQDWHVWGFRKQLPPTAIVISEVIYDDPLLPDYIYKLKAQVSEAEFAVYVAKYKLEPVTKDGQTLYEYKSDSGQSYMGAWYEDGCLNVHAWRK